MKAKKVSQTDFLEPIYSNATPPPAGKDVCGRTILRREEDPPRFERAMKNYRARTGKRVNANVWSFPDQDLIGSVESPKRTRKQYTAEEIQTRLAQIDRTVSHENVMKDAAGQRRKWPAGTVFDVKAGMINVPGKEPLSYQDWWDAMNA